MRKNKYKGKNRSRKNRLSFTSSLNKKDLPKANTLQKDGSNSSLTSFGVTTGVKAVARDSFSALNQQSLDQLGPIVKMTLNGYPFSFAATPSGSAAQLSFTEQTDISTNLGTQSSVLQSTSSFQMNSLIMN